MKNLSIYHKISRRFKNLTLIIQSKLNESKLKLRGAIIGKKPFIPGHLYVDLKDGASVSIGNNFTFTNGQGLNPLSRNLRGMIFCDFGAKLEIGDNVGISSSTIWVKENIIIKDFVNVGANSIIMDTDAHSLDHEIRRDKVLNLRNQTKDQQFAKSKAIVIDEDVLIGANCVILKGVHIGARTIIGAGSVVTKDIPADSVAAGNPCIVIRRSTQ